MKKFKNLVLIICSFCFLFVLSDEVSAQEYRAINGSNNNITNPTWGAAGSELQNFTTNGYSDLISEPGGITRPNPRKISNYLFSQKLNTPDQLALSDFVWVFGQFVDHDITLTENSRSETAFIFMPEDEPIFGINSIIPMFRSLKKEGTGTDLENPRKYNNEITAYVDGSQIYGSDEERATWLRSFVDGKLKVSSGNLLPWNSTTGEFSDPKDPRVPFMANDNANSGTNSTKLFVAGDVRANENPLLISLHTIFVREHNRICELLKVEDATLTDEQLYWSARKLNVAKYQSIVFNEWLPAMGVFLPNYQGYDQSMNASIYNVFSAAAFRLGHTLINSNIIRMDNNGAIIPIGNINLRDAFFEPQQVILAGGIDPYIKGMATQIQQELDCKVIDDVRNFLFGSPDAGGLDLAAININRGRERGLPDYNTIRWDFGLPAANSFTAITDNPEDAQRLKSLYGSMDNIDPWVGMLAEKHMPDALFGELIMTILEEQFRLLRDGDRFYYENYDFFSDELLEKIRKITLKDIIYKNTYIDLMQDNVFGAMPHSNIPSGPEIDQIQLASDLYPNPTDDEISIKLYLDNESDIVVRIYDQEGKYILQDTQTLPAGENVINYKLSGQLTKGIFNVWLGTDYSYRILKFVKS